MGDVSRMRGADDAPPGMRRVQVWGEQWETSEPYSISIDAPGFTTIRACIDCGALIAGGPTRCLYCGERRPPSLPWWRRLWAWVKGARDHG